jgi:hypothetical protein
MQIAGVRTQTDADKVRYQRNMAILGSEIPGDV